MEVMQKKRICGSDLMKKFLLFGFIFIFCLSYVFSLEYEINQGSFSKGDFVELTGTAKGEVSIVFTANPGNKEINSFVSQVDSNGSFSFKYFISCTDPAGDWTLVLSDADDSVERMFSVSSSVECEYLKVDFISPSSSSFFRKDVFDVRVKVTDAGNPIDNAEVYFWDFEGKKNRMYPELNGVYYFEKVVIPLDAELKKTSLMVLALSAGKEKRGGSNVVSFEVRKVPINIEVISPLVKEFTFGKPLDLKVRPVYANDKSIVENADISIEFNNEKFKLEQEGDGVYSKLILTEDFNSEIFYVNVVANDSFGNSGSISLDFEPKGFLYFYIAQNAIVYVFPILFVLYILFVSFKQGKIFVKRLLIKRKRKTLIILMKKLQDDYFNNQLISREVYSQQFEDYNRELTAIENELAELERKQELS